MPAPPPAPGQAQQYGAAAAPAPAPAPAQTVGALADNVAALLCYIPGFVVAIIFLAIAPYNQNKFVRFHAWQAIFFGAAWVAFWIAEAIVGMILPSVLSILLSLLTLVIWLGGIAVTVLLMLKAYQGEKWQLPVIGPIAEKQA